MWDFAHLVSGEGPFIVMRPSVNISLAAVAHLGVNKSLILTGLAETIVQVKFIVTMRGSHRLKTELIFLGKPVHT